MYNHYIRIDENNIVLYGFTDAFEQPQEGDILILEDGPRGFLEAFPYPLTDDNGVHLFKWDGTQIVERTQQEKDDELAAQTPGPPSVEERLAAAEELILTMMLGG